MTNLTIQNKSFDEERALYNSHNLSLVNCSFKGPRDGESALKESSNVNLTECDFSLRYPLWHVDTFSLRTVTMDEYTRAAIWYSRHGEIENSTLKGIKAVRECQNISMKNCKIVSEEFGWMSSNISLQDTSVESEYLFMHSSNITMNNVKMKGKYSFQYIENLSITDSVLDTKDAFWHSKNVTVENSIVKGEYLGWFSKNLTLKNCKIIGTQPLCYCENLTLIDCTMENCDLSFEYSSVEASVNGHIDSVKNPLSGTITCDSVGEIIREDSVKKCTGEVIIR